MHTNFWITFEIQSKAFFLLLYISDLTTGLVEQLIFFPYFNLDNIAIVTD